MRVRINIVIIVVSLFMLSCGDKNSLQPIIDYSDTDLATQLSHYRYADKYYYVQFYPSGDFIQKAYDTRLNGDNTSIQIYERTGKYRLEDSLIILSDIKINFNKTLKGISILWWDQEVYLNNGKIAFRNVTVLNGKVKKTDLWNYWTTVKWVYHYVEDANIVYNGREEYFYEFSQTNPQVRFGYDYMDGKLWPPSEFSSDYLYSNQVLSINLTAEKVSVMFKKDKMYWYYIPYYLDKSIGSGISALPLATESIKLH